MHIKTRKFLKEVGDTLFVIGLALSIAGMLFKTWLTFGFLILLIIGYIISEKTSTIPSSSAKNITPNTLKRLPFSTKHLDRLMDPIERTFSIAAYIYGFILLAVIIIFYFLNGYLKQHNTQNKLNEIVLELEKYKKANSIYPPTLNEIIKSNPLKSDWKNDNWGNKLVYETPNKGMSFHLISKGKDGVLQTEDDLVVKN